jgi:hypothetical protein
MINPTWHHERNDRSLRYAGRVLPPDHPIHLKLSEEYGRRYDGQIAAIVAINLLARMTPSIALSVPDVDVVPSLPWAGMKLQRLLLEIAFAADPFGQFEPRELRNGDYALFFGRESSPATVHGSGWNAFIGRSASPVPDSAQINPIGPALAVITAIGRVFALQMQTIDGPYLFNAFNWRNLIVPDSEDPVFDPQFDHGSLWTIGLGSVGTAALYFLSLATLRFSPTLFDMDEAKTLNLDRSPVFSASDAGVLRKKVHAMEAYLRSIGIHDVKSEPFPLDQSEVWLTRQAGTPDLIISAANERDVRYIIEQSAPPIQIYGTTGANWEASVIRHIPMVDACSCCLFPPGNPKPVVTCATDAVVNRSTGKVVDASLPFLSFGAGLMAAAEILKIAMPGYPFSPNRTTLYMHPSAPARLVSLPIRRRPECVCAGRSALVHARMIEGTKHQHLSSAKAAENPLHLRKTA